MYSLKNVTDVTSPHRISGTPQAAMFFLPPGVKLHLTPVTAISLIGINFTLSGHTQTAWLCPSQPELLQAESECTRSLPFPWASLLQAQTAKHGSQAWPGLWFSVLISIHCAVMGMF